MAAVSRSMDDALRGEAGKVLDICDRPYIKIAYNALTIQMPVPIEQAQFDYRLPEMLTHYLREHTMRLRGDGKCELTLEFRGKTFPDARPVRRAFHKLIADIFIIETAPPTSPIGNPLLISASIENMAGFLSIINCDHFATDLKNGVDTLKSETLANLSKGGATYSPSPEI